MEVFLMTGVSLFCLTILGLGVFGYLSLVGLKLALRAFKSWSLFGAFLAWKLAKDREPASLIRAHAARTALVDIIDITHRTFDQQRMKAGTSFRLQAIRQRAEDGLGEVIS